MAGRSAGVAGRSLRFCISSPFILYLRARGISMVDPNPPILSGWENFYVIVGSSAAALIGLQFVVIALIKDLRTRTSSGTISAFGTPTVVHLGGALIVSS